MKKVKLTQVFFMLVCLLGYRVASGQSDYVVTIKRDTVYGDVKYLNFGTEKNVQVSPPNKKKIVYSILEIIAFKQAGEIYCPVRYDQHYTCMKLLKSGYLSLYAFQVDRQITWDGRYLLKKDGRGIEVPTLGFKRVLNKFLAECPEVTSRIVSGELTRSNVNGVIDEFNRCIDANTKKQSLPEIAAPIKPSDRWRALENGVINLPGFEQKVNALEMITEINTKISKAEKIPNFLTEGLKVALKDQSSIQDILEKALAELKN